MEIFYKPTFFRQLKKLPPQLQEIVFEKIEQFEDVSNHERLQVHKLHGKLHGFYSFSVDYSYRIIFSYANDKQVVRIHEIGNHKIYE